MICNNKLIIYKNVKTLTGQYVRNYCQFIFVIVAYCKNSLKIPKGKSESVNRRTDNTMVKRKKDNRTNKNLQNTTQKTKERTTRARTPSIYRFWFPLWYLQTVLAICNNYEYKLAIISHILSCECFYILINN
jgi:hypothetical protein